MFDVSVSLKNNKIFGSFVVDSYFFEKSKYDYAFYLCEEGKKGKLNARWYEDSMEVVFDVADTTGDLYIRCFIRDKEVKNTRTFDSKVISKS